MTTSRIIGHRLAFLITVALTCGAITLAQVRTAAPEPEVDPFSSTDAFQAAIRGTIWETVGTFQVKRVRYAGRHMQALDFNNVTLTVYRDTTVVDPGVIKVEYPDRTSGWYVFDENLEIVLPTKVEHWFECERNTGKEERAALKTWNTRDVLGHQSLRIKDSTVEMSDAGKDEPYIAPSHVVTRDIVEFADDKGAIWWAVPSHDGAKLWLLQVRNSFGGLKWKAGRVTQVPATAPAFLQEREKRLIDFVQQMEMRHQTGEAYTLKCELDRRAALRFGMEAPETKALRTALGLDLKES